MKRNLIFVLVSAVLFCFSANAQTNKNKKSELNRELEVTREYEPIVKTATKIDVKPNLVDTVKLRHEFNYTITMDKAYNRDRFSIKPIGVADVNVVTQRRSVEQLNVTAGLGFPFQSLADVNYALVNSPKTQVNLNLNHRGQWAKIENDAQVKSPAAQTQNQLSFFANRTWSKGAILGEVYGLFDKYTRYGYFNNGNPLPDTFDNSKSALAQRFSGGGVEFALTNMGDVLNVNLLFDAASVSDKFDGGRTDLNARLGLGHTFKNDHSLNVELGARVAKGKNVNKTDITSISVAPFYMMNLGKTTLGLGCEIASANAGDDSEVLFFPKFKYETQIKNNLSIYANVGGGAYVDRYMANPYLVSEAVAPLSKHYSLQAGLAGNSRKVRFAIGVEFDMLKDYAAYINLVNDNFLYNGFGYITDDVDVIKGVANLDWRISDKVSFQSGILFRSAKSSNFSDALYMPAYEALIALKYNSKKFQARVKCDFVGEQYFSEMGVDNPLVSTIVKADGYVNLGVECNYKFNEKMSFGIEARNITNSEIYEFNHYKSIGANLLAKINLKF